MDIGILIRLDRVETSLEVTVRDRAARRYRYQIALYDFLVIVENLPRPPTVLHSLVPYFCRSRKFLVLACDLSSFQSIPVVDLILLRNKSTKNRIRRSVVEILLCAVR